MSKEICISTTPHETRLAILENDELTEIYYERENEYTLAGSIYKGKVTRVLPGMQSAFVDVGLERDAFLYVTDFLEEQEDGADFERADGGGQKPRKEGGREGSGSREANRENGGREGSQSREPREPRTRQPQAAAAQPEIVTEPVVEAEADEDSDSPSGTRRWRGRRGRKRGFRPRGQQEDGQSTDAVTSASDTGADRTPASTPRPDRVAVEPFEAEAPRGHRSSHAEPAAGQKIVLPGESLSKYGGTPVADAQQPEVAAKQPVVLSGINYVAPKPSTLIEAPIVWDGGMLMAGESLSRYRGKAETQHEEPAAEVHTTEALSSEPHEHEALSAVVEHEAITEEPFVAPPAEQPEVELHGAPDAVHGVHEHAHAEAQPVHAEPIQAEHVEPVEAAQEPVLQGEVHEEIVEEVHEFEPESASASHRIDPVAPSEFRVPSVIEEEPASYETEFKTEHEEIREEEIHEHASEAPVAHEEAHAQLAPFTVEHEEVNHENGDHENGDHEQAGSHDAVTGEAEQPYGFTPGTGVLEEETIDEDEYDFEPVHAYADEHDSEDLEEETLDHAGPELGEMVREAHLNKRLAHGPDSEEESEEDEDDDLEFGEAENDAEGDESDEEEGDEEDSFEVAEAGATVGEAVSTETAAPKREGDRGGDRRGGRRGRGDHRGGRQGGGGHQRGRQGGGRRQSAQTMDLPIISDLLKQGQEILVQIAKEPIAKKGARITSHIALPGRFLVFMPTVNHVGVSRKISSDEERQRLKRILISEKGEASGGFIVRTAADGASEEELRADLRFLISLWSEIKQREEASKAPALIYHDLNLVERVLRDQVSDNFSAIWVDNEAEYERTVRFLNRFQPSLVRRVKLYTKETPLFEHFGIQEEISKALKSKVWLKSGGSIVINQTEALVAIDINTGKYVGKTARLEDTILKTNLDAIPEIVRQIRLRDLGGIIVIDFIDMDERKNRHKVMQALEDELKNDRAPSKVLQFNDFGLVAITRKRVKQSLERTLSTPCNICSGTGMVKSPTTVANEIYVEMRKMQKHLDRGDVMLRVNPEVVKTLKAGNGHWLTELEELVGKTIIVKSDPALHPEQFDIH